MTQTLAPPIHTVNWNLTLDNLKRGKSVLFLGPEVYRFLPQLSTDAALAAFLDAENPGHPHIKSYYTEDGLFLLKAKYFKSSLIYDIRRYYAQELTETLETFQKLARIPFHLIVNLTPDNRLSQIFQTVGIDHQFDFYEKNKPPRALPFPIEEKPVVYNLLGYLEEEESLILTHDDLYDFIKSVHKGDSMDAVLREALLSARQYCFLGLPYRKWYMQLLLRILSVHIKEMPYERLALERELDAPYLKLYQEQFEMQFVETHFTEFVNELYQRCEAQGILRMPQIQPTGSSSFSNANLDDALQAIGQGETGKAIGILTEYVEARKMQDMQLYTNVLMLKSRYAKWQHESTLGILSADQKNLEFAQITYTTIQLITEARKIK